MGVEVSLDVHHDTCWGQCPQYTGDNEGV